MEYVNGGDLFFHYFNNDEKAFTEVCDSHLIWDYAIKTRSNNC